MSQELHMEEKSIHIVDLFSDPTHQIVRLTLCLVGWLVGSLFGCLVVWLVCWFFIQSRNVNH